jgi:hypothetical protein
MRRALMVASLLAATLVFAPTAKGLPIPPLATSPNVQLVTNVPGSYAGLNFKDHYAFATSWAQGLVVFDISTPDAPTPVATVPLPHFENEDVDLCGDTLLISNDRESKDFGGILYVIDIATPSAPQVLASLPLGLTGEGRGPGHIANFVKSDCSQVWVDGGDHVEVIDLTDRAAPKDVGEFQSFAAVGPDPSTLPAFVVTHDSELDATGTVWQVGGGGVAGYEPSSDPLQPTLVSSSGAEGVNVDFNEANSKYNDFILHNSKRASDDTLLITEEDYIDQNGGDQTPGSCNGQGKFETWSIAPGQGAMKPVDTWQTELDGFVAGGKAEDSKAPITVNCSSHWFDYRDGIAAVGWYEQGVRFLDVTDPSDIRQIGYYLPADGATWAAYWVPGSTDLVYTADPARGLDVLRISTGRALAPTVQAPVLDTWFGVPGTKPGMAGYQPTQSYGWSCVLPKI